MSEFISFTPEAETTEERFAWDEILRALHTLSNIDDSFGLYETIEDLKDESLEDGLMMVFNYAVAIEVSEGKSSDLDEVMQLLQDNGMLEEWSDEI